MERTVTPINQGGHRNRVLARRDRLIEQHLDLVPPIAKRIHRILPPSFDLEDLIATGNLALLRVATIYRPKKHGDTPFSAFARHRIRGAMIDSIRRRHFVENTRPSIDEEPEAERIGEAGLQGHGVKRQIPDSSPLADADIDHERLLGRVTKALGALSEIQLNVLNKYYSDELDHLTHAHWKRRAIVARMHDQILEILRKELAS